MKRAAAEEGVRDIYEMDIDAGRSAIEKAKSAFSIMQEGYMKYTPNAYNYVMREFDERATEFGQFDDVDAKRRWAAHNALRDFERLAVFANLERQFQAALGVNLPKDVVAVLRANHFRFIIADWLSIALAEAYQSGIVADKGRLPATSHNGITLVNAGNGERLGLADFQDILDLGDAEKFLASRLGEIMASQPLSLQKAVIGVATRLTRPNLVFNAARTQELKKKARESVAPVTYRVMKGELIVREGEKLNAAQTAIIESLKSGIKFGGKLQSAAGAAIFILLLMFACAYYMKSFMPEFTEERANVVLFVLISAAQAEFFRLFAAGAEPFAAHSQGLSLGSYLYAAPYALAPMLGAIFFTRETAFLATIVSAFTAGVLFHPTHHYILYAFAGGVVAVFHVGRFMRRSDVWMVGMRIAALNFIIIAMAQMLDGRLFARGTGSDYVFGAVGALFTVALTLTLTPLIEGFFPVVSDIKLLELQDLNHPLLAKLAVVAPGTYHHSVIVGNLAKDAAEAIGANPLLARVGSYFHDIGKLYKPEYFIENQRDGINRHDNLTPSMSALIITSHVTKGLEMAKQYKLIPQIEAIISEHHGTSVIQYFYHRAREQEKDGPVNDQNFRYPGRKPRSRESAVVALADSVEAATRALKNPTSSRLRQTVSKIINDKYVSGQLEESHLTLHDINMIGDSFVKILHGIFHYRVEYPGDKNENENTDEGKAGNRAPELLQDKEKAHVDIKRAG
jgi:hypothetical protein